MLADILKPQATSITLGDTISRGSMSFCGFNESIESPATSHKPYLDDELPNVEGGLNSASGGVSWHILA
jgi:hypothetical protein